MLVVLLFIAVFIFNAYVIYRGVKNHKNIR
jgi:hypothetical protein